jgi:hypothetical protein
VPYLLAVSWITLYVPWEQRIRTVRRPIGYAFLWEPPVDYGGSVTVNLAPVVLSLVAVTAFFAAIALVFSVVHSAVRGERR